VGDKVARVRLMLNAGSFLGGMGQVGAKVRTEALSMKTALAGSATAGLSSVKTTLASMGGQLKSTLKMAATMGGTFAVGASIKGAMDLQHEYRNLAQQVNRLVDTGKDWRDMQQIIEAAATKASQAPQKMIQTFRTVYSATGDLEYTVAALDAIGTAATASGEEAEKMGQAMQLAARKFGVGAGEAREAVARLVEKIGVGGMSLDDLNGRFAVMAGEAAAAGLKGVEGFSTLLGIMLALDSTIGEKAAPGMKALFQYLKDNTAQLAAMEKKAGIKFEPDLSAFDKIRKLLGTEKGRVAAQLTFTADSRVVYDTLAKPFEEAYKAALAAGESQKKATQKGLAAYDQAMEAMTKSNAKFSRLQDQAAERMREDPTVIMRQALNELAMAFTEPAMMDAVKDLASSLPKVAKGAAMLIKLVTEHPGLAAGGYVGGRVALSFAAGSLAHVGQTIGTRAGTDLATTATRHAGWGGVGPTIGKAGAIALASYLAIELGKLAIDEIFKKKGKAEGAGVVADIHTAQALRGGDPAKIEAALKREREALKELEKAKSGFFEHVFGQLAPGGKGTERLAMGPGAYTGQWGAAGAEGKPILAGWSEEVEKRKARIAALEQKRELVAAMREATEWLVPQAKESGGTGTRLDEGKIGKTAGDAAGKAAGDAAGRAIRSLRDRPLEVKIANAPGGTGGHGLPPSPGNQPGSTPR
jgi:hypothetical protein